MVLRPLLAAAALCAVVTGLGYWQSQREAAALRLGAWEQRQSDEQLLERLDRPFDSPGNELTLANFADLLAKESGLEVELDQSALAAAGVRPQINRIAIPRGRISLRSLLRHALSDLRLAYDVRQGQLRITTPEAVEALSAMYLVVYPLPQPNLTTRDATAEVWGELITTSIEPQTWDDVGGPAHLQAVPGGLVVMQTREIHEMIRALLDRLGSLDNPPTSWEPVHYPDSDPSPVERQIQAALARPFAFTFDSAGLPLDEFFTRLADEYEIPIVLDRRRIEEAGILLDTPISVSLRGVPFQSALLHILDDLELTWVVRDDALLITTPEEAECRLTTIIYPVHDLVAGRRGPDSEPLIDLITTTVSPQSWDDVGGPGSLQAIAGGWMIVSQTDEVHEQLRDLLDLTRQALSQGGRRPYPIFKASSAELRIEAALEREISLSYYGTPLCDVARDLSESLGINVVLDTKKLEEAGVNPDTAVTCEHPAAPLRMQLERLLRPIELRFVSRDDVLLVTTPEECECQLVTNLYDVRPLVDDDLGITDDETLADLITSTISVQSWDEVGGPGSIVAFRGLLVVSQTSDLHRPLAGLLARLEEQCLQRSAPAPIGNPAVTTGVRILPDAAEEQIEAALAQRLSIELDEVPLHSALDQLAAQTGVSIQLDRQGLKEQGIPAFFRVSLSARDTTLAGVLDRLLDPLGLQFVIWNRQIVISNREDCESQLQTRLYRVPWLASSQILEAERQCDQLMNDVEPTYWDLSGGPGSYFYVGSGWVVITADLERHLSLADRLHERRTGQKTQRARERDELRAAREAPEQE